LKLEVEEKQTKISEMQNEIHYLLKQLMDSNVKSARANIRSQVSEAEGEHTKSYHSITKSTAELQVSQHMQ